MEHNYIFYKEKYWKNMLHPKKNYDEGYLGDALALYINICWHEKEYYNQTLI